MEVALALKRRMTKYAEIYERYKLSGLSQKAFSVQEGISPSMVSYYVNKAKREQRVISNNFAPIQITTRSRDDKFIQVTTSKGIKITIPI